MELMLANIDWYFSVSSRNGIPPRCPYAKENKCPVYYLSRSLLGSVGITTVIPAYEEKQLSEKWEKSEYWPRLPEHEPRIYGPCDKGFSHFCPEVAFEVFGLFASELHRYADEIDIDGAHKQLRNQGAPATDWRWQWSNITPLHYSECQLYSQLVSTNVVGIDKIETKEIIEVKPGIFGITVDMKVLAKRLWKWLVLIR
jgi:hypothetical protein